MIHKAPPENIKQVAKIIFISGVTFLSIALYGFFDPEQVIALTGLDQQMVNIISAISGVMGFCEIGAALIMFRKSDTKRL